MGLINYFGDKIIEKKNNDKKSLIPLINNPNTICIEKNKNKLKENLKILDSEGQNYLKIQEKLFSSKRELKIYDNSGRQIIFLKENRIKLNSILSVSGLINGNVYKSNNKNQFCYSDFNDWHIEKIKRNLFKLCSRSNVIAIISPKCEDDSEGYDILYSKDFNDIAIIVFVISLMCIKMSRSKDIDEFRIRNGLMNA